MAYQYLPKEEAKKRRQAYYQKNRATFVRAARARQDTMRAWVQAQKDRPCADCRKRFPTFVMDFDHRPGETKVLQVSLLYRHGSWSKLRREIVKCDVVCANCHRIRTQKRLVRD